MAHCKRVERWNTRRCCCAAIETAHHGILYNVQQDSNDACGFAWHPLLSAFNHLLVDRSGFMAGLTSVSIQSWRARCSTMWISGSILTWYARHKVLGVCLMSWSICNHECKDPLSRSSVTWPNCQDTLGDNGPL